MPLARPTVGYRKGNALRWRSVAVDCALLEGSASPRIGNWVQAQTGTPLMARGAGGVGVSAPLQFNPISTNPIAISFLQLGPNSEIPIPHGTRTAISIPPLGPNINDWVPAIGWVLSIVGAIIFGRNTNTMADLLVTRNASGLFSAFVNGHIAFSVMDTGGATGFSGTSSTFSWTIFRHC